jgi:hypothetical protein
VAFLIDPASRCVSEVKFDDPAFDDLRKKEAQYLNEAGDVLYESGTGDGYCVYEGIRRPQRGFLLIVGTTEDGEDCEPVVRFKEISESLDFGTARNGMYYGDAIVRAIQ